MGFSLFVLIFPALIAITLFLGIKAVPQGFNYTVERFGRYRITLQPGINIILPYIDTIGQKVNMMERFLEVPSQEVITLDNASVTVDGITYFQVLDAAKAAYEILGLENAILNLATTNLRAVMGSMDLDDLLSNRDKINSRLLEVVDRAVSPWGVKITRIEIKNIDPPQDLAQAMAGQMKAEREKRAAILLAEGERQAEILKADGQKQAQILEAEGRKEAAFRDAEARERAAEAEANATQAVSKAIESGDIQAINYFVATKYVEAFGQFASSPNQKLFVLPTDATALMGSLAGIAEIAKDAGLGNTSRPRGTVPRTGE